MPKILFGIAGMIVLVTCFFSGCAGMRSVSPVSGARQMILVVAENDTTFRARMGTFSLVRGGWRAEAAWPVVIGRNGMAWGRGLHREGDRDPRRPVKREGDGKTPEGVFTLPRAFGYAPADSARTRLPYTQADADLICIDDVRSEFYNTVTGVAEKGMDRDRLPSHERMLREDGLYRYVILVGHNIAPRDRGAGSCIFLHVWRGEDSGTSGCTAMTEERMTELFAWLDPGERPVIVQLTRADYMRLRAAWGLPEM